MQESIDHAFPTIDMTRVGRSIRKLHDHVCINGKRVEITRAGCKDRCVMISKSELDTLENALEIFSNTEEFGKICASLQQLLETAGVVYHPQAQ